MAQRYLQVADEAEFMPSHERDGLTSATVIPCQPGEPIQTTIGRKAREEHSVGQAGQGDCLTDATHSNKASKSGWTEASHGYPFRDRVQRPTSRLDEG